MLQLKLPPSELDYLWRLFIDLVPIPISNESHKTEEMELRVKMGREELMELMVSTAIKEVSITKEWHKMVAMVEVVTAETEAMEATEAMAVMAELEEMEAMELVQMVTEAMVVMAVTAALEG